MVQSFSDLRKQSKNIEQVQKTLKNSEGKKDYKDARFWKAALDKTGNGEAVIRFLPAPPNEDLSYVKLWSHFFNGPGGYYIENCPTTVGLDCPCCEDNGVHWKSGDAGMAFVRNRGSKRHLEYITNVLVVKDPANPENEGKVFLFKYGAKIHKKYMDAISPEFASDEPYLPYDLDGGANFKLRINRIKGGDGKSYASFDQSTFDARGPIKGTDAELEVIWRSQHSLSEFVNPETQFKTYDALATKLTKATSPAKGKSQNISQSFEPVAGTPTSLENTNSNSVEETDENILDTEKLDEVSIDDDVESLRNLIKD